MPALNLIVKGDKHAAALAASERGVPFAFRDELPAMGYTTGSTSEDHLDKVVNWFCERALDGSLLYPAGTLMHYSDAPEASHV